MTDGMIDADASLTVHGIAPAELARRHVRPHAKLKAAELARWLVNAGLAVDVDGLLRPTPLGFELGDALRIII